MDNTEIHLLNRAHTQFNFRDNEHEKAWYRVGASQKKSAAITHRFWNGTTHLATVSWHLFCEPSHFFFIFAESCTCAVPIEQEEFVITNKLNIIHELNEDYENKMLTINVQNENNQNAF